nr:unnamed protein product [Callosobruchus analis]
MSTKARQYGGENLYYGPAKHTLYQCLLYTHKNKGTFETLGNNSSHITRKTSVLKIPKHRTATFQRSPAHQCTKIYNHLPSKYKRHRRPKKSLCNYARTPSDEMISINWTFLDETVTSPSTVRPYDPAFAWLYPGSDIVVSPGYRRGGAVQPTAARGRSPGQADFEQMLIDVLKYKDVTESITNIILRTITSTLNDKFKYYDEKIAQLESEIINLKSGKGDLQNNSKGEAIQKNVEQKLENILQHIKNNNIRIMQVPEADDENLSEKVYQIFKDKMKVDINRSEITAAYRVGRQNGNKPRHILASFKDNCIKMAAYNKKKMLKGSKVIIKEDLTIPRLKVVKNASEKYGFKNVWTVNGHIFARSDKGVEKIHLDYTVKTQKTTANKKIIFSEHLKEQINSLNNLNWVRRRLSSAKIEEDCKKLKKSVEANIKLEKSNYYNNLINNSVNRSKMLWQLVNSKRDSGVSNKAIPEISYNGTTYTNNIDIANAFGEYFSTVIKDKLHSHFSELSQECTTGKQVQHSMLFFPVTPDDVNGLINVYYGLIYSNISYGITVWGLAKDVERVFIVQKRIIRLICKIPYRNTCRDAFRKYKILTVPSIYLYKILMYIYEYSNNQKLIKHHDQHEYNAIRITLFRINSIIPTL